MEPNLETPRTREKRNRALRHMMLAWHLVQGLRAYARLQNNPQYNSFKERIEQGGQQLTGEDVHNLSVFFHFTWVAELLAVTRVQNISPPLSVKDRGVLPVRAVPPLPLRGRGHKEILLVLGLHKGEEYPCSLFRPHLYQRRLGDKI